MLITSLKWKEERRGEERRGGEGRGEERRGERMRNKFTEISKKGFLPPPLPSQCRGSGIIGKEKSKVSGGVMEVGGVGEV